MIVDLGKRLLPEGAKAAIQSSGRYEDFYNRAHSRRLAGTDKRLDICANETALYLLQAGQKEHAIRDKICLEIGSGWLLTHSLVLHLLGAQKVYACDISPLLQPQYIARAVRESIKWSILDSISVFEDRRIVSSRLDRLASIDEFSVETLEALGIEYVAPIDLSKTFPWPEKVDFIFSKSVLEHVPVYDVEPLLQNLANGLSDGGWMFHLIHLVDHKNRNRPFDFFTLPTSSYPPEIQTKRGNRIRASEWNQIFNKIDGLDTDFVFEWPSEHGDLPAQIDSSIQYHNEEDLRTSHVGVVGRASERTG